MFKNKFNLRNVVVIAICLAGQAMFSGCNFNTKKTTPQKTTSQKANETLSVSIDESLTFKDLFKDEKYKSLNADVDFKDYIKEYWEANSGFSQEFSIGKINTFSEMNILDEKVSKKSGDNPMEDLDKVKGLFSLAGKGAKGIFNTVADGYKLIKLEDKREKLFSGFSAEKQKTAVEFETKANNIIEHSYMYIENDNVKENDVFQNYKSVKASLKSDKNVKKEIEKLCEMVDEFYKKNTKIKEILVLNKIINQTDYSSVVEFGNNLLTSDNNDTKIKIKPTLLKDYFSDINNILTKINNPKFDIPIEDWSEEKQENIKFIHNDIKTRLSKEINSLNYNPL